MLQNGDSEIPKYTVQAWTSFALAAFLIFASGCALKTSSKNGNSSNLPLTPSFVPENLEPQPQQNDKNSPTVILPAPSPSTIVIEKKISENTWGMEFKHTPIENAHVDQKNWGKAIALISNANGATATGFFVSDDGLFITNHHVIPRFECNAQKCDGIRVIRDFHTQGEFEVFSSFQILYQDPDLDITLLKIALKSGEKVPFLHLMDAHESDAEKEILDSLENREVLMLGHPNSAALHVSKAYVKSSISDFIKLDSVAMPGSSGSPVIDLKTGSVVAIHYSGYWDKGSVKKVSGSVKHISEAVKVKSLMVIFRQVFGTQVNEDGILKSDQFTTVQNNFGYKNVIPFSPEEAFEEFKKTKIFHKISSIASQFLGTRHEKEAIRLVFDTVSGSSIFEGGIDEFMHSIIQLSYARGKAIYLEEELFKDLVLRIRSEPLSSETLIEKTKLNAFRVLQGSLSQARCISEMEKGREIKSSADAFNLYEDLEDYCLASRLTSGASILDAVALNWGVFVKEIDVKMSDSNEKSDILETAYRDVLYRIQGQMNMSTGDIDPATLKAMIEATDYIREHATRLTTYAFADKLKTFLIRSPQMIQRGAFNL